MFLHRRIFVIEVFFDAIVNEACIATDVMFIAVLTHDLVDSVSL